MKPSLSFAKLIMVGMAWLCLTPTHASQDDIFVLVNTKTVQDLPNALYDGYWVQTQDVGGQYNVINFHQKHGQLYGTNQTFVCQDGKYHQINSETSLLTATEQGFLMRDGNSQPSSYLTFFGLKPKTALIIKQDLANELLSKHFPDGILFKYWHDDEPVPACHWLRKSQS